MIRTTLVVMTAVAGMGVGAMAAGPSADATQTAAAARTTVTGARPAAVNTPRMTVKSRDLKARLASGYIFVGPKFDFGAPPKNYTIGPEIADTQGRPIYFQNSKPGDRATDVREQTYRGQPVFTFWLGHTGANPGIGEGNDHILNSHYKTIRIVHGHGTLDGKPIYADQHEFLLTPGGTALITCYALTRINATKWGGAANQLMYDSIAEEINLTTGKMVLEWRALTHVSPGRSMLPPPKDAHGNPDANTPWDYFHINAIKVDTDHNLIISGRHTWAIYKVNRHHGNIMWQLQSGNHTTGPASNFTIGKGAAFSWQHDPEPLGNNEYRLFDNSWNQVMPHKEPAHVLTLKLDLVHHTATNLGHVNYAGPTMYAGSQGNSQQLASGHVFVGWGAGGDFTEINASRQQIWDASFSTGYNSYRAYKSDWVGTPSYPPSISMHTVRGTKQADAVWNGASTVARWRILSGPSPSRLASVGSIAWNGLDTAFRLSPWRAYVRAVALDARGRVLGRTAAVHT